MTEPRRISVVVPTRDRPAFLRQSMASIRAIEGPDLVFDILVGDNGNHPDTRGIVAEFGGVYLKVDQNGSSAARNACIKAAATEFIAFLDDDDAWLAGNVRPQLEFLLANPAMEGVLGQVIYADKDLKPLGPPFPETHPGEGDTLLRAMLSGWFPQIGTLLVRASIREHIGYMDLKLLGGQDLDWMVRIARRRSLGFLMNPCILFRGRPPGSYDKLQHRRIGFDRKVFLRHAVPEWKIWKSPAGFARGYTGTLKHFYDYFAHAAEDRATEGRNLAALRAAWICFGILPLHTGYHMLVASPLRRGILGAFGLRRRKPAESAATPVPKS